MATHSSTLAWKIPWMEEPGRLVHRVTKSWTRLHFHFHFLQIKNKSFQAPLYFFPMLSIQVCITRKIFFFPETTFVCIFKKRIKTPRAPHQLSFAGSAGTKVDIESWVLQLC